MNAAAIHVMQPKGADGGPQEQTKERKYATGAPLVFPWRDERSPLYTQANAGVAELVDALGLGPSAARFGGSSPSARTTV